MNKPIFISIEGNIGSGKTTLINNIRTLYPDWNIIDEPVDSWLALQDDSGKSLLELFYSDKERWSYTFQNTAFMTRYTSMINAVKGWDSSKSNIFILERCILTDRYVFAEMLKDSNCLTKLEWDLYLKWFNVFSDLSTINGIIYITTDYSICNDRIKTRSRKGEDSIPLDYLNSLETQHEKWLSNCNIPILNITSSIEEIPKMEQWISKLNKNI